MAPEDAESSVKERLEGLGYEVQKLETREAYGLKTADFSAVLDQEALVIDVKARQFDGEVERQMRNGERLIEVFKRLDEGTEEHSALARFLHGKLQIEETPTSGSSGSSGCSPARPSACVWMHRGCTGTCWACARSS